MAIEFYAMPNEQAVWLHKQIGELRLWCWVRKSRAASYILDDESEIEVQGFINKEILEFDLGVKGNTKPVLNAIPDGLELDLARSQGVQFEPSRLIDEEILLRGQLAIPPKWAFREAGISDDRAGKLYRRLQKDLKRIMSREHVVTQSTTSGCTKDWPSIYITPGVVKFKRDGGLLKEFVVGPVTFDIRDKVAK